MVSLKAFLLLSVLCFLWDTGVEGLMDSWDVRQYCDDYLQEAGNLLLWKQDDENPCQINCHYEFGKRTMMCDDGSDCSPGKMATHACLNSRCRKLSRTGKPVCNALQARRAFVVDSNQCEVLCVPEDGSASSVMPLPNGERCVYEQGEETTTTTTTTTTSTSAPTEPTTTTTSAPIEPTTTTTSAPTEPEPTTDSDIPRDDTTAPTATTPVTATTPAETTIVAGIQARYRGECYNGKCRKYQKLVTPVPTTTTPPRTTTEVLSTTETSSVTEPFTTTTAATTT